MTQNKPNTLRLISRDFHHDVYGNPTSHFEIWADGRLMHKTKRRSQCGYHDDRLEHAKYWLRTNHINIDEYKETERYGSRSEDMIKIEYEHVLA